MSAAARQGARHCSTTTSKQSKLTLSGPFQELCYQHLLHGQLKQHWCRNWLFGKADTTNWKISLKEQWFKLHSDSDTAFTLPLQLLGTFSAETDSFLFAHRSPEVLDTAPSVVNKIQSLSSMYSDIPEFQMPFIEHCDENLPYILSSIMLSVLDIDGYYVGSFPYHSGQPTVFVLMDQLERHSDFNAAEWKDVRSRWMLKSMLNSV